MRTRAYVPVPYTHVTEGVTRPVFKILITLFENFSYV
jgi:hypothetical protein